MNVISDNSKIYIKYILLFNDLYHLLIILSLKLNKNYYYIIMDNSKSNFTLKEVKMISLLIISVEYFLNIYYYLFHRIV